MTTETGAHRAGSLRAKAIFLILAGLLTSSPCCSLWASNPTECSLWKGARDTINSMKPFRVSFIQQVYYGEDMSVEESGDLLFVENRRIRWTYRNPELKVFLLIGNQYQFFEPEARQLTTGRVDADQKGWIWDMLVSSEKSAIRKCDVNNRSLEIEEAGEGIIYIVFLDENHRVLRVEYTDSGGGRHLFHFSDYKPGVKVQENDFQLIIPPGTEVIHREEESPQPG